MELTSGIVFAVISLVKKVLNFFIDWRHDRHEAEKAEALQEATQAIQDATSEGTLADLINAANKMGEAKRK